MSETTLCGGRNVLAAALLACATAALAQESPARASVDMQWAVKIPMRDGTKLNATIYRPHGQRDRLPLVFTLTPYIGDS
jgi:predicted acyl esterase